MKQFWCGAVIPGCKARFTGKDEQEILEQVAAHAACDHQLTDIPAHVIERVKELIDDAA